MALILDISHKKEHLLVGLHVPGATVQSYEEIGSDFATVIQTSRHMVDLIERNCLARQLSPGILTELKKNGQVLFDYLIPSKIKAHLRTRKDIDLTLLIDEGLVFVPWELLFDGTDFLCLRFYTGRCVKTKQSVAHASVRALRHPLPMLVVADPRGDLAQARSEAVMIREKLAGSKAITVTTKTKNVYCHYIQKNVRDYEILHYAGHAEFDSDDPQNSGWLLTDGALTARDFIKLADGDALPQLIFMNACRSVASLPEQDHALEQGLFGLANALLTAGGRFVIGALSRVGDDSASQMAGLFYEHLAKKGHVGLALCHSRRELVRRLGDDDLAWAAYVLYGDPSGTIFDRPGKGLVPAGSQTVSVPRKTPGQRIATVVGLVILSGLCWASPRWLADGERRQGSKFFMSGSYGEAALHFERALRYFPDERERLKIYEYLANAASLARSYSEADDWFKKTMHLSGGKPQSPTMTRLILSRAENIRLAHLDDRWSGSLKPAADLSLARAIELYEQADQDARKQNDTAVMARAQSGLARTFRIKGDWGRAIRHYQNAVEIREKLPSRTLLEMSELSHAYLELAGLYIDPQLNFKDALSCLVKADKVVREMISGMAASRSEQEYRVSFTIFLRRLERLMFNLAQNGYENSEFYRKSGEIYDQLRSVTFP